MNKPVRYALSRKLDDEFDPTDADAAMSVAVSALRLLRICQRVLFADNAGVRVGRDDATRLAVAMREVAEKIGLLEHHADAEKSTAFHAALALEAGFESPSTPTKE